MSEEIRLVLDKKYNTSEYNENKLHIFSNQSTKDIIRELFSDKSELNINIFESFLKKSKDLFSIIVDTKNYMFCAVDCVASRPIYYKKKNGTLFISDNPRNIRDKDEYIDTSSSAFNEFYMSGFVCGTNTLISNIKQLQAGELLFFDKKTRAVKLKRYFKYFPEGNSDSKTNLFNSLNQICNEIFQKIIDRSQNEQIVVPLSGGYDSRFILAKLCELGAKNLITFSYGNKKSHELKKAKRYAEMLNVKWIHINPKRNDLKFFFSGSDSIDYFNFSDGLRTIPTLSDFYSIKLLLSKKIINEKSIIINGQSGDFTTGNHIPSEIYNNNLNIDDVVNIIYKRHFSVFSHKKNENIDFIIKNKIKSQLEDLNNGPDIETNFCSLYESWEWQERQSKYVVNGQRVYEYFDLRWELPLWEPKFCRYWNNISNELRFKQTLYKQYLSWYDYRKVFSTNLPDIKLRTFPGRIGAIIVLLDKFTVILPKRFRLIKYLSYFSHYSFAFKFFSLKEFIFQIPYINCPPQGRGVMGMIINKWKVLNKQLLSSP